MNKSIQGRGRGLIHRSRIVLAALGLVGALAAAMPAWSTTSQTRTSSFEYDASGLLTKEIVEPDNAALCVVTSYTYDGYGNRLSATTRNCNGSAGSHPGINSEAAAPTGTAVFASRTTSYTYTDDKRFVKTATNALNQSETKEYDNRFGAPNKLTGPNGLATEWTYDEFGRKTLEIQAYASGAATTVGTKWEYLFCSGINGGTAACPSGIKGPANAVGTGIGGSAKYVVIATPVSIDTASKVAGSAIGPYTKAYYDEFNRAIRTETQGFDGAGTAQLIVKDTAYNTLGQVAYTSRPYFQGAASVYWDHTEYDLLGRVTRHEYQDDAGTWQAETADYDGLVITSTNAKAQKTVKTNNSQGQVATVKDHNGKILAYTYDAFGNLLTTAVQGQESTTTITLSYDLKGRKTGMVDPDMGTWSYVYNALGELVRQTDAKSQVTTTSYDKLGRMVARVEGDLTSNWYYDANQNGTSCGKGIGKLCEARSDNGYNRQHTYDALGRPASSSNVIDGATYTTSTGYDSLGRTASQTYPTGFASKFVYTTLGYLKELRKNSDNALYWQAVSMAADGRLTSVKVGSSGQVQTTKTFNPYTGRITAISGGTGGGMGVLNLAYTYDSIGNVLTRQDTNQSLSETFTHDGLNRITSASVNANATGFVTTSYAYNDLGNLVCKSDLGTCSATAPNIAYNATAYNAANQAVRTLIHAVASVSGNVHGATNPTYSYDLNGNMTSGAGFAIAYASFNMVKQITHASKDGVDYLYGSEHQRIRERILTAGTLAAKEITHYLHPDMTNGLFYERVQVGSTTRHKHYLTAGGEVVAVVEDTVTTATVTSTRYLHRDYLGSVVAVTDDAGAVLERYAYDAFGKRRHPNGTTDPLDAIRATQTDRGFTNHEHLDALGLINMNGRFYDPSLGRFMSADPFIQAPDNIQSYNRYSYVMNNPLGMTDPSGYLSLGGIFKSARKVLGALVCPYCVKEWRPIINTMVIAYTTGQFVGVGMGFGSIAGGAAGGFAGSYYSSGGNINEALKGAVVGGAFGWAGDLSGPAHYLAHAAIGCASAAMNNQNCGNGALAQVVSLGVTDATGKLGMESRFVAATLAGGVTSQIMGGKFETGAFTAAYGYLFNAMAHEARARLIGAGAFLGGSAGAVAAGGCTLGTGGFCALGAPTIVAAGAATGAATGGFIANVVDWLDSVINNDYVTPDPVQGDPERFRRGPNGTRIDNEDGSVWDKNKGNGHGGDQWKRWPNIKDWEKGRNRESVWPDGRVRGD